MEEGVHGEEFPRAPLFHSYLMGYAGEELQDNHWQTIDEVRTEASVCCRCNLCYTRTNVVFGCGAVPSRLMVVGEGPGAEEDKEATPFVGRAGRLLDQIFLKSGIRREDMWITNIVRCRPTAKEGETVRNRAPRSPEITACNIWMEQEYRFVSPSVVICLGAVPAQALIGRGFRIGEGRGALHNGRRGIPTTATYHPAYVLRLRGPDRARIEGLMIKDFRMAAEHMAAEGTQK